MALSAISRPFALLIGDKNYTELTQGHLPINSVEQQAYPEARVAVAQVQRMQVT